MTLAEVWTVWVLSTWNCFYFSVFGNIWLLFFYCRFLLPPKPRCQQMPSRCFPSQPTKSRSQVLKILILTLHLLMVIVLLCFWFCFLSRSGLMYFSQFHLIFFFCHLLITFSTVVLALYFLLTLLYVITSCMILCFNTCHVYCILCE